VIGIKVTADISKVEHLFDNLRKDQVPFATALALTKTAQYVQGELTKAMDTVFDRPTPYTKNALYVKPATKSSLVAVVKVKDESFKGNPAVRYLFPEITGGTRTLKGFEKLLQRAGVMPAGWYAIPTSAALLDAYGNVSGGVVTRILSQLQAARDSLTNESAVLKAKRNRTKRNARYFAVNPATERGKLKPGIYERLGSVWGSGIRPIFLYTQKQPSYAARYDFYGMAKRLAAERYPIEAEAAIKQALATAR
jgi:hypothetical protein